MDPGFALLRPLLLTAAAAVLIALPQLLPEADRRRGWLPLLSFLLAATLFLALGNVWGDLLLGLSACIACGYFSYRYYVRPALPLARSRRWWCAACRTLALIGLLAVLGRPVWNSQYQEMHRPLLVALLDHSLSIGLRDPADGEGPTRAEQANSMLQSERTALQKLETLYEVRRMTLAGTGGTVTRWDLEPGTERTQIAAAVERAALQRSSLGETPAGLLLLSDGGENVAPPGAVLDAGRSLRQREIPLFAIGVGPGPERTPGVLLDPLLLPGEIGLRDTLDVNVAARAFGCDGRRLQIEVAWEDPVDARSVLVRGNRQRLRESFTVVPPRAGLQRLSVAITLPEELGGDRFETSRVINVRNETVRVLLLSRQPNSETAFISRALRSDTRFELTTALRPEIGDIVPRDDWSNFDVVVLGRVRLTREESSALAAAVRSAGTGLLLHGGRRLLNDPEIPLGRLVEVSPANFQLRRPELREVQPRFTPRGQRHEILRGLGEASRFEQLPTLAGGATIGQPKSLAETLLVDQGGDPLLLVQNVAAGRSALATWEATWPWALASDDGSRWHTQFWRQMCNWLANRRPQAWVLSDQARYDRRALLGGSASIEIEAGVTGTGVQDLPWQAELELLQQGTDNVWQLPLQRRGGVWRVRLPDDRPDLQPEPGLYQLRFTAQANDPDGALTLEATSGFVLADLDAELQSPTANLGLLRSAADQTRDVGGRYVALDELGGLLQELTAEDPRTSVTRRAQLRSTERHPWSWWMPIVGLLVLEWVLRKRSGLP